MVISPLMGKGFSLTLLGGWTAPAEAVSTSFLSGLAAHEKLLLFSEGSMTVELELLTGRRVEVELRQMGERELSPDEAAFLGISPDEAALEREVWLKANGTRLLYARTLLPLCRLDPGVKEALGQTGTEPLGRLLTSRGILFAKERLEASLVRCEAAASGLGLGSDAPLYARRYILYSRGEQGWVIEAAVTEVFSPGLIRGAGAAR